MVNITVKLVGALRRYLPPDSQNGEAEFELAGEATINSLMQTLSLPNDQRYLVSVNGEFIPAAKTAAYGLNADDRITIMPPLKGG